MENINTFVNTLNGYLFHQWVVYALLFCGVLFTIWSGIGQYRALTHGVAVTRGKYDDKGDPGAINHFQALSAALSATVGLGNIGGVAVAVALGGPGAILWMWVIGLVGMALKMTEVTQSMLYRNTADPDNPHGGPMFVVKHGLSGPDKKPMGIALALAFSVVIMGLTYASGSPLVLGIGGLVALGLIALAFANHAVLGALIGGVFVVTLIISAITGGNMFQVWNVADITFTYFRVPQVVTSIILTVLVGLVIIGGIKRIGSVAGRIVPFMCFVYVLAAAFVLFVNVSEIPAAFMLIIRSGLPESLGGETAVPSGAFLGGTFGYAAMWGIKRALFSSEAGQGSSPIAHSAAKTDEPVREGVVAGLEPFIDTLVVCTLTALVILTTGAYSREPESAFATDAPVRIEFKSEEAGLIPADLVVTQTGDAWEVEDVPVPTRVPTESEIKARDESNKPLPEWEKGDPVFVYVDVEPGDGRQLVASGKVDEDDDGNLVIDFAPFEKHDAADEDITNAVATTTLYHGAKPAWTFQSDAALPPLTDEAKRIRQSAENSAGWREGETVFVVVSAEQNADTGRELRRIPGTVKKGSDSDENLWSVEWNTLESNIRPTWRLDDDGNPDFGIYGDYAGASMTAYAFDRAAPGLGKVVVTIAAWLFALSTMISWSYYGEQGIYYLFTTSGEAGTKSAVLVYKFVYCLLIFLTGVAAMPLFPDPKATGTKKALIATDVEIDMWTTLGLGVMLVANIPIMLVFSRKAFAAYHEYMGRLKRGELDSHTPASLEDVMGGKDVE